MPANSVFDIYGIIKPNGITRKLNGVENWLVCVAGVRKGGIRERRAREARKDRTRSFWLFSLSTASQGGYKLTQQVSDHLVPFLEFIYRWLALSFAKDRTFIIKVFRARSVLALSQIPALFLHVLHRSSLRAERCKPTHCVSKLETTVYLREDFLCYDCKDESSVAKIVYDQRRLN